ncbi:MAG TPA: ABC transporter ATP-binding protein [Solirubrobacterales bacterium]|jgi:ATP-binding cassette subfamily B protein|nr:ABC transporter ATP-binding protein [Solirubrobacterales bacterium]
MSRASASAVQPVRLGDFQSKEERQRGWRQVPRLTIDAMRVAWDASRRQLILTLLLQAGAGIAMTLQLLAAQHVLEKLLVIALPETSGSDIILPFAALIVAMVVMGGLTALADQSQRLLGELVAQHAFRQIIGVSTRVELAAFENHEFHDQLERARGSAISRSIMLISSVSSLTLNLLTSGGIAIALLILEPLLLPLVLVSGVPMLLATILNGRRAYQFEWAMTPENRERAYLMELLTKREAAKELRVFDATSFLRERYDRLTGERLRRMRGYLRERVGVALIGSVSSTVGMGVALAALAYFIATGRIPVATALTAGAAMQQLSTRMFGMNNSLGQVVESGMFIDDYNSFLELLPEVEEVAEEPSPAAADGREPRFNGLEVENVSFRYPDTAATVLDGVSLRIDPGEVVALVGENGSGKTTLVKLICQLYEPLSGRIRWRGEDGLEVDPSAIRADTTVLFQDFLQYHLTVADNIALGRPQRQATPEAIAAAARQAGADRLVERLPDGYDTRLGRQFVDGHELSIGQWQRLSLARAFYRGGGFLVLDEPTASLDPKAEVALFQQMRELWSGRAVLLISHRFSSVRSADRIYVMRDGRIAEAGNHAELMAAAGHYAELFSLQAAAYLDGEEVAPGGAARKKPSPVGVSQP